MKKLILLCLTALAVMTSAMDVRAQAPAKSAEAMAKSDADTENRATSWVSALNLNDTAKEARVTMVVSTHLKAVRDWHNSHPGTAIPDGTNAVTGKPLNNLDKQFIADSGIPKSVHENLMAGLRKDLTPEQVEVILDKYTEGKVAFTMNGYHSIVPDLTKQEEATILAFLKQAREQAVDYKGSKLISMVFEIYKTKSEQYLNSNGRNWKQMYRDYTKSIQEKKAAAAKAGAPEAKPAK